MDKRNLYKTGKLVGENTYVSILGFDASQGEGGHYRIGKAVYESGRTHDFNGALSMPSNRMERLTF